MPLKAKIERRSLKSRTSPKVALPSLARNRRVRVANAQGKPATRQRIIAPWFVMGRLMEIYPEFPIRLAVCSSPFEFWRESARLAHHIFMAMNFVVFGQSFRVPLPLP